MAGKHSLSSPARRQACVQRFFSFVSCLQSSKPAASRGTTSAPIGNYWSEFRKVLWRCLNAEYTYCIRLREENLNGVVYQCKAAAAGRLSPSDPLRGRKSNRVCLFQLETAHYLPAGGFFCIRKKEAQTPFRASSSPPLPFRSAFLQPACLPFIPSGAVLLGARRRRCPCLDSEHLCVRQRREIEEGDDTLILCKSSALCYFHVFKRCN